MIDTDVTGMTRQRQIRLLIGLFVVWLAFAILLSAWYPSIGGMPLRKAELAEPLSKLIATERVRFFTWLGVDTLFAVVYTIFYTAGLRVLAANSRSAGLDFLGRSLSWVTAFAIVFDLAENAILWTQASTAATAISSWLPALVKLKWLSTIIFFTYSAIWIIGRRDGHKPAAVT
jgi:hypothetical protein